MKYWLDLGSRKGVSLKWAVKHLRDVDKYIGFEPVPEFCKKLRIKFRSNSKVKINNAAIGIRDRGDAAFFLDKTLQQDDTIFIGKGSSLIEGMQNGEIIKVKGISLSNYILSNFKKSDYIIVKVDIEGMEYDVLEDIIRSGAIDYIDEMRCEWHIEQLTRKTDRGSESILKRHDNLIGSIENIFSMKKEFAVFGNHYVRKVSKND